MERIRWLDIVRVLAILSIISFHFAYELTRDSSLRVFGWFGVALFFMASGYVLATRYKEVKSKLSWWLSRYIKLAPLYYLTIIAVAILFGNQSYQQGIYDIIMHFFFLNWIDPSLVYTIISPAWFIIPLVACYLVFPFAAQILSKKPAIAALLFIPVFILRLQNPTEWLPTSNLLFIADFCFGMALAFNVNKLIVLAPLSLAVINLLYFLPYVVFVAFMLSAKWADGLGNILSPIASRTFELFLFHEAIMNLLVGKWTVYGMDKFMSLTITSIAFVAVVYASARITEIIKKSA